MNTINWSTYKFHCSGLSNLMTKSRKKDEILSETTKSYLRELWIQETYGREKVDMIGNRYVRKGIMCETDSLELVERVTGEIYLKNQKTLENEYIVGTPDVTVGKLIDIKTSWDLWTFAEVTEDKAKKDYYAQLLGYMWLLDKKEATLMYCLVNTPEVLISNELNKLSYILPEDQIKGYRKNYIFDDIPENKRIKSYSFVWDDGIIEDIKAKIVESRIYLESLALEQYMTQKMTKDDDVAVGDA